MTDPAQLERLASASAAQTEALAAGFAARLAPGDVVLLRGELGSGKTTFVRGAARALGAEGTVTSPSFTIGNFYATRAGELAHVDLYRLATLDVGDAAVLEDFIGDGRIAFIEWPHGELNDVPGLRAEIELAHAGGDDRAITIRWRERAA